MKACSQCGFYNTDSQERCIRCGAILDHQPELSLRDLPAKRQQAIATPFYLLKRQLYKIKAYFHFELPQDVEWRYPWVAGWLGLIPGLGQIYNHQFRKAFWFFIGWLILVAAFIKTITEWINIPISIVLLFYMLWSFNDGVVTATRINGQQWTLRKSLALFSYLLFAFGALFLLSQIFLSPFFLLVYVSQDTLAPGLRKGDRLFIDCVSYWFRSPHRGEIVYYDPPKYMIEIPGGFDHEVYVINERSGFGRVVAEQGDRYERRNGKYYLNGKPVPPELEPLTSTALWQDFAFERVPEGKFLVIIGHLSQESLIPGIGLLGVRSPKFSEGIVHGWKEACLVTKKEIFGRALFIYYPPPRRRWLVPSRTTLQRFDSRVR